MIDMFWDTRGTLVSPSYSFADMLGIKMLNMYSSKVYPSLSSYFMFSSVCLYLF